MTAGFENFMPYVHGLQKLCRQDVHKKGFRAWNQKAKFALDGEASRELRARVSLNLRRASGTFFTGSALADMALRDVNFQELKDGIFCDPTCGAGDLLIAAAKKLPIKATLGATVKNWSARLVGMDLRQEFVKASKTRLLLLARKRLLLRRMPNRKTSHFFTELKTGNALKDSANLKTATVVLLNPPFSSVRSPEECKWAGGNVNAAAVFLETILKQVRPKTKVVAILPEVLRTGSRYEKWRHEISNFARIKKIRQYGVFDSSADVDVFIGVFIRKKRLGSGLGRGTTEWQSPNTKQQRNVGENFAVSVGPVVPFRHPHVGPFRAYLHPRNAPQWATIKRISEKRRFKKPLVKPPFVVVRRTSRPGDTHRAIASIVTGKRPIAVENHLIVCKPLHGGTRECQKLIRTLKKLATTKFLNQRMRCRHLTVHAVREITYRPGRRTSSK